MKGMSDGYAKTPQGPQAGKAFQGDDDFGAGEGRGFRARDYAAYSFFGPVWFHPVVQRYVLTGEIAADAGGRFADEVAQAVRHFCGVERPWRPIGQLAADYLAFRQEQADAHCDALLAGRQAVELCDYLTGEVYLAVAEGFEPFAVASSNLAHECPYPGVVRGRLADRAVCRSRAPVSLPYRGEAR